MSRCVKLLDLRKLNETDDLFVKMIPLKQYSVTKLITTQNVSDVVTIKLLLSFFPIRFL